MQFAGMQMSRLKPLVEPLVEATSAWLHVPCGINNMEVDILQWLYIVFAGCSTHYAACTAHYAGRYICRCNTAKNVHIAHTPVHRQS